jgi:hypothetical protein
MKSRFPVLFLLLLLMYMPAFCQEYSIIGNDSLLAYYLHQPQLSIDTDASVIVLYKSEMYDLSDVGRIDPSKYNYAQGLEICFIVNKQEGKNMGDFTIPYSKFIKIKDLELIKVTLKDDKVVKEVIKRSDLLKETIVKGLKVYKINMNDMKVGTIVYLHYRFVASNSISNSLSNPDKYTWYPSGDFPIIDSRLEIKVSDQVNLKIDTSNIAFTRTTTEQYLNDVPNSYFIDSSARKSTRYIWRANNVNPIEDENFTEHSYYYWPKVNVVFYRNDYTPVVEADWQTGQKHDIFLNLGTYKSDNYEMNDTLTPISLKEFSKPGDSLAIAKAIYSFVRDSIKKNYAPPLRYIFDYTDYNTLLENRKAYTLDNNKLLTYLLRKNGFAACNTLLSTNDLVTKEKLDLYKINYLLTAVSINGKFYLLDAGFKYLPFGTILPKCYNGFAWVITNEGVNINLDPATIEDKNIISCSLMPDKSTGNFDLQIDQRLGKYSGAIFRADMKRDSADVNDDIESSKRELLKDDLIFKDYKIINKDSIDEPLKITYTLEYSVEKAGDFFYINPYFSKIASKNPFQNVTRHYPIEYDIPPNKTYLLKIKLPDGYALEENIEDKQLSFQNELFIYNQYATYDNASKTISMNYSFIAKTNIVPTKDYSEFRNFYEQIITEQNKKIVLKKE